MRLARCIALLAAMVATMRCEAASISVADGDSFQIDGRRYRLHGIDAPELHQTCRSRDGREWPCGRRARDELRKLLSGGNLECSPVATDRFERMVAACRVDGRDLGDSMVRNGWAVAHRARGASSRYVSAEQEARAAGRGIWSGSFEAPRQWRQGHPRGDARDDILSREARDWLRPKWQAISDWLRTIWLKP
jgi:endonuclease YncB( thermonuclease family)